MSSPLKLNETDKLHPVSARELYEWLGFNSAHWAKWHKKNITGNQFAIEGQDYIELTPSVRTQDFSLSIDFAKRLSMLARTEKGETIRKWFVDIEKQFREQVVILTPAQLLLQQAQQLVNMEARQVEVEKKVELLEAKTATRPDWFTIVGYATLNKIQCGLSLASQLGRKAQRLCKDRGIVYDSIPDPRFGKVGVYPPDVLKEVFDANVA